MNAGNALRFALIFLSGLMLFMWFQGSNDAPERQPIVVPSTVTPESRAPYEFCELATDSFRAQLTTRGATLRHFELLQKKYVKNGKPHDLSTTPQPGAVPGTPQEMDPAQPGDHEFRQQLFAQFRNLTSPGIPSSDGGPDWNIAFDSVDWTLAGSSPSRCEFRYRDANVALTKVVSTTERPYELEVSHTIENLDSRPKLHAFAVDTVAWWLDHDVESEMFRVSPYITHTECLFETATAVRMLPQDFEPDDFQAPEFARTGRFGWFQADQTPAAAAVSNAYFSHALVPLDPGSAPLCQLQIEYRSAPGAAASAAGAFYRARLAYPATTLEPGASAEYKVLSYIGPKEREVLRAAAGGKHHLDGLIDLGFFSFIAKYLVAYLLLLYSIVPNWGLAIILLTVTARVLLFPFAVPSIRTMIKMRELKPEMDELNEKYKDDMRAKGVAQMELWRKHGMTPFDQMKGCFPQLATMPVWFALYTTLQTAVELYNIPFLWFPDLSEQDPYFVLPFIIGATYFLQQKIMPFQGDPAQRKMMLYFMPAMFTVFMLFLPSGLGVYMFTNSLLAIGQQAIVEKYAKVQASKGAVEVKIKDDDGKGGSGKSKGSKGSKSAIEVSDDDSDEGKGGKGQRRNRRRQEA